MKPRELGSDKPSLLPEHSPTEGALRRDTRKSRLYSSTGAQMTCLFYPSWKTWRSVSARSFLLVPTSSLFPLRTLISS